MHSEHRPDKEEKIIRFIFGFVAGAILGAVSCFQIQFGVEIFLLVTVLASLTCGFAALHFGDRFWHGLLGSFRWW